MTLHIYMDAALTDPLSEGDLSNPDQDVFNGTDGDSKDRQLFLANERATLAQALSIDDVVLELTAPGFADTELIVIGAEQLRIVNGGGTTSLTIERGYGGTQPAEHPAVALAYSAYDYSQIQVQVTDTADTDESSWVRLAASQEHLDSADPGASVDLGPKNYSASLSFWRRITVPAGTPVQNKTDLKLLVTAMESPIL